jgi:hypothetical protein
VAGRELSFAEAPGRFDHDGGTGFLPRDLLRSRFMKERHKARPDSEAPGPELHLGKPWTVDRVVAQKMGHLPRLRKVIGPGELESQFGPLYAQAY